MRAVSLLPPLLACAAALPQHAETSAPLAKTEQVRHSDDVAVMRADVHRPERVSVFAAPQGLVQGRLRSSTANGGETQVAEYLGIPFAQPPTGAGRFAPPRPPMPVRRLRLASPAALVSRLPLTIVALTVHRAQRLRRDGL